VIFLQFRNGFKIINSVLNEGGSVLGKAEFIEKFDYICMLRQISFHDSFLHWGLGFLRRLGWRPGSYILIVGMGLLLGFRDLERRLRRFL
jgi:hypothetical protein